MTPLPQLNRFFISSDHSFYYRRVKSLHWETQAIAGYALLSPLRGNLDYTADQNQGHLAEGDSLILEPNARLAVSGKQVEILLLVYSAPLVVERADGMKLVAPISTVTFSLEPISDDSKLQQLLANFAAELLDNEPGKEIVLRALAEQTLVQLLRQYAKSRRSDELEFSRVGLIDRRIRRSVELMHTQVDQDLSLKALAAASYLSPFHFARLFKKLTGATPHSYLATIRTNRAQLLLAETDLSVAQISAQVGYLSSSHFTKAFRLATGTTPREFRKALIRI